MVDSTDIFQNPSLLLSYSLLSLKSSQWVADIYNNIQFIDILHEV